MFSSVVVLLHLLLGLQAATPSPQQLFWTDRAGRVGASIGQPQSLITGPVLSSDGTRVLVRARDRDGEMDDIWIHSVAGAAKTRVTTDAAHERHPDFSPRGDRVVFYSYRNGLADLYIRNADGSGQDEPLAMNTLVHEYGPSWSPDGNTIAYHAHDPKTDKRELMYIAAGAQRRATLFLPGSPGIAMPRFSPDGRNLAYVSNESGKWDVYVRAFPGGRESVRISSSGGMWPKWSARTNELFFFDGASLMAVTIQRQDPLTVSAPKKVFAAADVGLSGNLTDAFNPLFDVSPDGQRFVIVRAVK